MAPGALATTGTLASSSSSSLIHEVEGKRGQGPKNSSFSHGIVLTSAGLSV